MVFDRSTKDHLSLLGNKNTHYFKPKKKTNSNIYYSNKTKKKKTNEFI